MSLILVVEDEPALLRGLKDNLTVDGHDVLTAPDGETGYRFARDAKPDLLILDLMLPKLSGFEICRKLRSEGVQTPILILTARSEEADRVLGLDLGADDYVVKPFSVRELMARVRALLRRSRPGTSPQGAELNELKFADVAIDFVRYEATRGDKAVDLTRKEFGVMRYLGARPGIVVTRDELLDAVWGYDATPTTRTVDNHIATIRGKLEPEEPRHLITVHGVGYKFVP